MKTTHNRKIQNLMGNHPSTYDGYLVRFGRYLDRCISPDTLCNNLSDDEIIHDELCQKANKDILKFHTGYNFLMPVSMVRWNRIQKVREENPNMTFNLF